MVEFLVINDEYSLKCCFFDIKGFFLVSIFKSGKVDGLKLLNNMYEKIRDLSDIEIVVVKYVLFELKEFFYRFLGEDVSDFGILKLLKLLFFFFFS